MLAKIFVRLRSDVAFGAQCFVLLCIGASSAPGQTFALPKAKVEPKSKVEVRFVPLGDAFVASVERDGYRSVLEPGNESFRLLHVKLQRKKYVVRGVFARNDQGMVLSLIVAPSLTAVASP